MEDNEKKEIKENENIDIEKEIEEEKRDIVKELSKKKSKSKKNDFSKTTSVPVIDMRKKFCWQYIKRKHLLCKKLKDKYIKKL